MHYILSCGIWALITKYFHSMKLQKKVPPARKLGLPSQTNSDTIMLFGFTRPYARLFIQQKITKKRYRHHKSKQYRLTVWCYLEVRSLFLYTALMFSFVPQPKLL